ncbi:MAG TPA: hypothetical protein VJ972_05980 [Anaerolineales bacterium]|nr:hypothetical protein [Anaerolineales bacterium]
MTKMHFSPRSIFRIIAVWMVLSLAVLACGIGAGSAPAEEPAAPESTSAAVEEPAEAVPTSPPALIPTQIIPATSVPAIPERRRLTLEFPPQIRAGDSDVVRLTLEVDDLGNIVPTAQVEGNVVTGEVVEIPNLYETHHVIAEAKFDIAGVQISPSELSSQTLSQGQSVSFYWSVRPQDVGVYRGTIWFYLRFVDNVSGEESQKTVSAQLVEIEAVNVLGLPTGLVRTFGGVGSVVGAVIGFPFFEDIVRFIFGRRKRLRK